MRKTHKPTAQALAELQARRATANAERVLSADSDKVTANIDHVIGPSAVPPAGLGLETLLPLLAGRPGRRTIIIVEDQK